MKKTLLLVTFTVACAAFTFAQQKISIDVIMGNRPANPKEAQMMRMEEQKHPNIDRAIHAIHDAMDDLNKAPDDFGGHKGQALNDLKASYISLRKALYFRLYEDRR